MQPPTQCQERLILYLSYPISTQDISLSVHLGLSSINLTLSIASSNMSQNLKNQALWVGILPSILSMLELSIIIYPIGILFRTTLLFQYYRHESTYGATNIMVQPLGFAGTFMSPFWSLIYPSCVNLCSFIYFYTRYISFMYYSIFFLQLRMFSFSTKWMNRWLIDVQVRISYSFLFEFNYTRIQSTEFAEKEFLSCRE